MIAKNSPGYSQIGSPHVRVSSHDRALPGKIRHAPDTVLAVIREFEDGRKRAPARGEGLTRHSTGTVA